VRWRRSQADIGCRCPFFRAVPELTRSADIQLNNRLSLRRHREMLSQPQIVGGKLMDSAQGCGNQAAECIRLKKSAPTRIKPGFSEISLLVGQELQAKSTDTMSLCGNGAALTERSGAAAMYELIIIKHSQTKWEWQVCDNKGNVRKQGFERNRRVAKYRGERALFLLLAARASHR
jgi:hypothetical protein